MKLTSLMVAFIMMFVSSVLFIGCDDDDSAHYLLGWWHRVDDLGRDNYMGLDQEGWIHTVLAFPDTTVICQSLRYEIDGDIVHVSAPDGTPVTDLDFAYGSTDGEGIWVQPLDEVQRIYFSRSDTPLEFLEKCL